MNTLKPRHKHAINPLMKKGGAHTKSKSSKRSKEKQQLRKDLKNIKDL